MHHLNQFLCFAFSKGQTIFHTLLKAEHKNRFKNAWIMCPLKNYYELTIDEPIKIVNKSEKNMQWNFILHYPKYMDGFNQESIDLYAFFDNIDRHFFTLIWHVSIILGLFIRILFTSTFLCILKATLLCRKNIPSYWHALLNFILPLECYFTILLNKRFDYSGNFVI